MSSAMQLSDTELVKAVLNRDPYAVNNFIEKFALPIYNMVKSLCRMFNLTKEDIEDCSQDVMLHVFRNLGKWNPKDGNLTAWIARVAKNKTLDNIKKVLKKQDFFTSLDAVKNAEQEDFYNLLDILQSGDLTPEEETIEEEGRIMLIDAIEALSEPQREVIIRHYYLGQSYSVISTTLNIPETTVTTRLSHARSALAKYLGDHFLKR